MSENPFSYIVLQSTEDTASGFNDIGLMTMFWRLAGLKVNIAAITENFNIFWTNSEGVEVEYFLLTLNFH